MYARLWWSGTSLSALVLSCDDIHELCGGTNSISARPVWDHGKGIFKIT